MIGTHHARRCGKLAEEIEAARLGSAAGNDILDGGVTNMADGEHDSGGSGGDSPDFMSESEHGPVVVYSAEAGVERIG